MYIGSEIAGHCKVLAMKVITFIKIMVVMC